MLSACFDFCPSACFAPVCLFHVQRHCKSGTSLLLSCCDQLAPCRGLSHLSCGAAGVQLVKLTPYRSQVSIFFTLQCIVILSIVGLRGGVLSYSAVSTLWHCCFSSPYCDADPGPLLGTEAPISTHWDSINYIRSASRHRPFWSCLIVLGDITSACSVCVRVHCSFVMAPATAHADWKRLPQHQDEEGKTTLLGVVSERHGSPKRFPSD